MKRPDVQARIAALQVIRRQHDDAAFIDELKQGWAEQRRASIESLVRRLQGGS